MALLDSIAGRITNALEMIAPQTSSRMSRAEMTLSDPFPMADPDERQWQIVGSGSNINPWMSKGLVETDRILLRQKARKVVRHNPHGRAIMRNLIKYTLGRGVKPKWGEQIDKEKDKRDKLNDFWRDTAQGLDWRQFCVELLTRSARDGEFALRKGAKEMPVMTGLPGRPKKKKLLTPRFIDPELIRNPSNGSEEEGVVTDPSDVQTVLSYRKVKASDMTVLDEQIKADEVIFHKIETDSNEKRGVTMLACVIPFIEMYDAWLQDRMVLSRVRSSVALVRTFDGSATQVKARLQAESDTQRSQLAMRGETKPIFTQDVKQSRFRPGTVINATKGVDYKFIAPNLQASDVHHDGRAILLAMCAGTGLAEFMISGDASNANYASTLIAEGPAVKEFQFWQELLGEIFTKVWIWAVEFGRINADDRIPADYDPRTIAWGFPDMVARNRVHDVQANIAMAEGGAMSRRTMMERDGLDYETEQARLVDEADDIEAIMKARSAKLGIQNLNAIVLNGGNPGNPGQARNNMGRGNDTPGTAGDEPNNAGGNADVSGTQ